MKKILIFILMLFFSKGFTQIWRDIPKTSILKNKIAEVKVFDVKNPQKYLSENIYYDVFGKILKDIHSKADGSKWAKYSNRYNEQNQLVYSLEEINNTSTKYKYDEAGNLIEYISIKADSTLKNHTKIIYEKNLKTKEFCKKTNSDDFYLKTNYFYSNDGLCIKQERFYESGQILVTEEFEYDKNNKLIFSYPKSNIYKNNQTEYLYNKNGDLRKVKIFNGTVCKFKYDKLGNRIEETTYDGGYRILDHKKYQYNFFE